jgi:hypothetical protein
LSLEKAIVGLKGVDMWSTPTTMLMSITRAVQAGVFGV